MKLFFYVVRTAFVAMVAGVFGLWLLQLLFSYVLELSELSEHYNAWAAWQYVWSKAPYFLMQFMPTGVLLGAVVGLGALASNSEIVAMQSFGLSTSRLVVWVLVPALWFVGLGLFVNEWVLPKSRVHLDSALVSVDGYWAKTQEGEIDRFVYIGKAQESGVLDDVRLFDFVDGRLAFAMTAPSAQHQRGFAWQLSNPVVLYPKWAIAKTHMTLPIDKSAIHLLVKTPDEMSISELYAHKALMTHQGTHSKRHELVFWQKLVSPFSVIALLLVACSFVFGSLRSHSLGFRVVLALLTGLMFSYLKDLAGFVALVSALPVLPMVVLPLVLMALVGIYLLRRT